MEGDLSDDVRVRKVSFPGAQGDPIQARCFEGVGDVGDGRPGVLLVHEVFGPDRHMFELGARFARAGYSVLLPDLYSREGLPGPASTHEDPAPIWERELIRAAVEGMGDRRALADLDAGLAFLGAHADVASDALAVVGFCMGGTLSFLLGCTSTRVAAIVEFYGAPKRSFLSAAHPFQPIELSLNLDRPFLGFFGERDAGIPLADVELLRAALAAGSKDFDIVTYPDADHGFFNDRRAGYHAASAEDAWSRTLAFLRERL